jgi:hypothetical protein
VAVDLTFQVREAVVAFLRGQGALTAMLPAGRIFGQVQPPNTPYPFIRFGTPSITPLEYSCQDGVTVTADLHVFSENELEAAAIAAEVVAVLNRKRLSIDGGEMDARWTGSQMLRDPEEADLWHVPVTFEYEASV